ncbi:CHAT domain-containing protein [Nostoc sp. PCC 7107]|uniref:nSTAND1 domain-containing NTPase n=1 Tax=Nostoc sp. PCC 7107 TaxID=317936 RepID=UPI00029F1697|nr:CHAT domain-containing protein [Nostoc sp. PCC 7107]AFY43471.1 WD40 repeat-containing protein [Nostoc sp. PCC 7107]
MNTFEIIIQRKSGDSWPIVVEYSRTGTLLPLRAEGNLQLTETDLQQQISLLGQPQKYGTLLGKALFQDEIRDGFTAAIRESNDCLRVLLFIEATDKELRTLRWERLCAPLDEGWQMLALDQRVPFSLYIPATTDRRFPPIGRRDLRALVLVASPSDSKKYQLDLFDVEATVKSVRSALGDIPCDVLANVDGAIGLPTLDELCTHLTDRTKQYTLLHFVSHGKLLDNGETVLYWSKADDTVEAVTATRLLDRLRLVRGAKGLPHFAFLCTCESAHPDAEAGLGGVGQRLVRDLGMPAVIAMTEKVTVKTAQALTEHFYKQLRESGEVDTALQEATASLAERQDVTVPALFSRLGGRPLFSDQLDRNLTPAEIEFGLEQLKKLLLERSPILYPKLHTPAQKLINTFGTDNTTLSPQANQEREQALIEVNNLTLEVLDLSFNAVALNKQLPVYDSRCPFLGLYPFRQQNREFFFGREQLITQLEQKLTQHNFLAVLGASGSGKSSVVLAGLIPTLQEKQLGLALAYLTPSNNPTEQLQVSLAAVQNQPSIIVVDQFEELFTLCSDETQRQEFIQQLISLSKQQPVIVTMRADFWGECATYRQLKELMESNQKLIGAMDSAELRKAMELQALQVGLRFEAGLSNNILDDVQGEPGAMPLLQHALLELWKRRHGKWLRILEYEAIGGVQKAIAQTADEVYNSLSADEQEQVKNIFIRLTRLDENAVQGEKRRDTRRRVGLEELIPAGDKQALTKNLLKRLAGEGARLIVVSVDSATFQEEVEVAHEALIRYWPRLITWLDENRVNLQLRETIRQAALEWEKQQKDENYLAHRGGRLEDAQELLQQSGFLNQIESEYVSACAAFHLRQEKEKITRRRREITTIFIISGGTIITLIITALLFKSLDLWRKGELNETKASSLNSLALFNSHQELKSVVLAIKSGKKRQEQNNFKRLFSEPLSLIHPPEPLKEILEKINVGKSKQKLDQSQPVVIEALQKAVYQIKERNRLIKHEAAIQTIAFSPNGQIIASGSADKTIRIWDLHGKELKILREHQAIITSLAFSPDGKTLASASEDGEVKIWNVEHLDDKNLTSTSKQVWQSEEVITKISFSSNSQNLIIAGLFDVSIWDLTQLKSEPKLLTEEEGTEVVTSISLRPDGKMLAIAKVKAQDFDSDIKNKSITIELWNLGSQPQKISQSIKADQDIISSLVFSPDNKTLASASLDHIVKIWDLKQLKSKLQKTFKSPSNTQENGEDINIATDLLAFSPDSQTLAYGDGKTVKLWNLSTEKLQTSLNGHQADISSVAFSPDGGTLASAGGDNTIILWNLDGKLLNTLTGHEAAVNHLTLSPNGQILASASDDNTVKLWDLNGKLLHTLTGHKYAVTNIAFSPDNQTLASTSNDNTIILWNLDGTLIHKLTKNNYSLTNIVYSPGGYILASAGSDNNINLWDVNGNLLHSLKGHKYAITSVVFSHKNKIIATASKDKTIKLWNFQGELLQTIKGYQAAVTNIAFSHDDKFLVSSSEDGTLKLWNVQNKLSPSLIKPQYHLATVTSLVFSPDDKTVIFGSADGTIKLWDMQGKKIRNLTGHQAAVTSIIFDYKTNTFASTSDDNTVKYWNLNGTLLQTFRGHQAAVTSVVFHPDKRILISASKDKTIKFWKLNKIGQPLKHSDTVTSVVFSRDGKTLASGGYDKSINLWKLDGTELTLVNSISPAFKDAKIITKIILSADSKHLVAATNDKNIFFWRLHGNESQKVDINLDDEHKGLVTSIALSPNGKTIASSSSDKTIKLWDLNGKLIKTLSDKSEITQVVFSPDSQNLLLISKDKTIKFWDLNGKLVKTLSDKSEVAQIAFSSDGQTLASISNDKNIKLWNLNGNLLHTLKGHESKVTSVVFSPDGKTLASSSKDKTVKLWDLDGHLLNTYFGHESLVTTVVFSPDGKTLASGSWDNTVRLWNIEETDLNKLLASACEWVKDYLKNSDDVEGSDRKICNDISLAQ